MFKRLLKWLGLRKQPPDIGVREPRRPVPSWVPDLLTGWTLIACGLIARRRAGLLLVATGFSWFAGNFMSSALVLHRGPLTQLVLTYPNGAPGQFPAIALPDHLAFPLRNTHQHVRHELPLRRRKIKAEVEADDVPAALVRLRQRPTEVDHAPRQTIKLRHHDPADLT